MLRPSRLRALFPALWLFALVALVPGGSSRAATFYVDGSSTGCNGSSCSNANSGLSESTAFATPQGCVEKMNGGDTCLIKNGTYTGPGSGNNVPEFNFCERNISGSAGQYTTIKNYPGHRPKFCADASCSGGALNGSGQIGVNSGGVCHHFWFEDLHVVGKFVIFGSRTSYNVNNIVVTGNEFEGGAGDQGNRTPARLENAAFVTFDHNYIHDLDAGQHSFSSPSLLKIFCIRDSIIEYNTLDGRGSIEMTHTIDDKDNTARNHHRFNLIVGGDTADSYASMRINNQAGCGIPSEDSKIYGNVFVDSGVWIVRETNRLDIHHNTFLGDKRPAFQTGAGPNANSQIRNVTWKDNLVKDANLEQVKISHNEWSDLQSGWQLDNNVYDNKNYRARAYGSGDTTYTSLAGWVSGTSRDQGSIEADCSLANVDNGDYSANSGACASASSTGGEVGAFAMTDCVGHLCDAIPDCADGFDNDGDGKADYPEDPGCTDANDIRELGNAACDNGLDDDGDGLKDFRASGGDPGCSGLADSDEDNCGNGTVDGNEQCDGGVPGGATCENQGFDGGALACSATCRFTGCVSSDECAVPNSQWLICDDFEDGTLDYWSADLATDSGRLTVTSDDAASGGSSLVQQHAPGGTGGWGARYFGDHPLTAGEQKRTELFARGYVKFDAGYQWPSVSNKMFIIASFEDWDAGYEGPNNWSPYYVIAEADETGFFTLTMRRKVGGVAWRGLDQNIGQPVQVSPGAWHRLEIRLKLNTLGSSDGIAEMWIDGTKKLEHTDVNFRDQYDQYGWNHFMISAYTNPSSPASQRQFWDAIVVSATAGDGGGSESPVPNVPGFDRTDRQDP